MARGQVLRDECGAHIGAEFTGSPRAACRVSAPSLPVGTLGGFSGSNKSSEVGEKRWRNPPRSRSDGGSSGLPGRPSADGAR
ncbi:predicted protein [Streptomyces sp. AA4]|nr:predicted protein [Streptomyces sp. AA4]